MALRQLAFENNRIPIENLQPPPLRRLYKLSLMTSKERPVKAKALFRDIDS